MLFRTIRKNLILIIFLIASSFIAIPIIHLIKAKISEPNQDFKVNQNYRDDASKLNLTKVHTIVAVEQEHTARQKQLRQLLKYANIPSPGEYWKKHFCFLLCIEPQGDSLFKTVCYHPTEPVNTSPADAQN